MKKFFAIIVFFLAAFQLFSQEEEKTVYGLVTTNNRPIKSVNVFVKGTTTGVLTNKKGRYSIEAKVNDTIVFSHVGMQSVEVAIKSNTHVLNIELLPKTEKLDEVVVKKRRAKTQKELLEEYPRNKNLIKTSLGIVDKDRASFPIRIIDGNDLIPVGRDFLYSLQNLDLRINVDRTHNPKHHIDQSRVYLRTISFGTSPTAIFDVDGVIYHQTPTFVDVADIDRVSILVGSGAIGRYGTEGVGGVIIINTKSNTLMEDMAVKRTYDNTDLRDSISKVLKQKDEAISKYPKYIKEYLSITSDEKAFEVFQQQRLQYADYVYYFIDVMDYFKSIWDNPKTSQQILGSVNLDLLSNISELKALAYKYEELGDYQNALDCYLKIKKYMPTEAQSYRDVANSYVQMGDFKKAINQHARYKIIVDKKENKILDNVEIKRILATEINNIVALNSNELSLKKYLPKEEKNIAARLVFEWNNDQAEFDLQFINPKQKYNSWQNNLIGEKVYGKNNKAKQYSKQFFLDNTLKGRWQIKINYHGNGTKIPTYLKITTYFDYGKRSQSSHIFVCRLVDDMSNLASLKINTKLEQVTLQ